MRKKFTYPSNFIKYLGTGGARFCMVSQARWTGGIWFSYGGLNGVIDPGPGSLYHICRADPPLDPHTLGALLLSHKHLDHSTDINVLAEAMTAGGFDRHGTVILPQDSVHSQGSVFLDYCADKVSTVVTAKDGDRIEIGCGVAVEPVPLVHHGVECFGYIFRHAGLPTWGIISDTKPLGYLADRYRECAYISINVTFLDRKNLNPKLEHLSVEDAKGLLKDLHPRLATIAHMGVKLLDHGPEKYINGLSTPQTRVIAGQDGMTVNLESLMVFAPVHRKEERAEKYRLI